MLCPQTKIQLVHIEYSYDYLIRENQKYIKEFYDNPLMKLIQSSAMESKAKRNKLLDCIQVFSNYFQKMAMLRYCFSDNKKFTPTAWEHLSEEFGHNHDLDKDRKFREAIWDPILEATASWFNLKMFSLDSEEKTVIVHLVLETSANVFFQKAHEVMKQYGETEYFKTHSEADEKHEKMGLELLENLSCEKYQSLFDIQKKGWDMLNAVCERISILI